MKQLQIKDILALTQKLIDGGMTWDDVKELPIYLGADDELNAIHTGWFINLVDTANKDDSYFVEMINEDHHNVKLEKKGILIS